ncbi:MAG TPA: hypothetical protein VD769_10850 [Gaiellaceae bacterium]|nr:hypothetical protein [Gaiellaceae bacterium]
MAHGADTRIVAAARRALYGTRERIAGTIYGTIVALGVLAAGSEGAQIDAWALDVIMVATVVVLWIAHVYAHALAESITGGLPLDLAAARRLAHRESSIVLAAAGPALVLLLGVFGVLSDEAAVWHAQALGVVVLTAQGVRYAQITGLGILATLLVVGVNLGLGLVIVGLKAALQH